MDMRQKGFHFISQFTISLAVNYINTITGKRTKYSKKLFWLILPRPWLRFFVFWGKVAPFSCKSFQIMLFFPTLFHLSLPHPQWHKKKFYLTSFYFFLVYNIEPPKHNSLNLKRLLKLFCCYVCVPYCNLAVVSSHPSHFFILYMTCVFAA